MIHSYAVDQRYVGEIRGKISHTLRGDELTISVTAPFRGEILIKCDTDISHTYWNLISLIEPQSEHIEEEDKCYYHTEQEFFYVGRYEAGKGVVPKKINSKWIIDYITNYQRLRLHFQSLYKLHKGQSCSFFGYAIDRNKRPMHPSTVESSFNKHEWFYNPFSFQIELLDENTIDDFVEETPISKEMTDKMVLYYKEQDKIKQQKEKEDKRKNGKEKWGARFGKINDHFGKYEKIYKYGVFGGILWLIGIILQLVI